jgi:hypothetical protein
VRLLLTAGTVAEDLTLFAQAPCNAGRMKHRRVRNLGLLAPAAGGQYDINAPYLSRFGQPGPGQKVFVVTCQHKNGWKGEDQVASTVAPPKPLPGQIKAGRKTQTQSSPG